MGPPSFSMNLFIITQKCHVAQHNTLLLFDLDVWIDRLFLNYYLACVLFQAHECPRFLKHGAH